MSSGPSFTPSRSLSNGPVIPPAGVDGPSSSIATAREPARENGKTFIQTLTEGQRPQSVSSTSLLGVTGVVKTSRAQATATPGPGARPELKVLAERALDAEKRVEALLAAAGRGKTFSASELIALQATVFRYSQTVEVLSRTTDRLVGALKQTLGTQV